jgi:hypothetical protein
MSRTKLTFIVDVDYPDHDLPVGYDAIALMDDLQEELRDVIKWSGPTLDCRVSVHPAVAGPEPSKS